MPSGLLGPRGEPIENYAAAGRPKNPKPVTGDAFGVWSGLSADFIHLPGGGTLQFDTSKLTFNDMRKMREHYQIGSSLHLLTFMLHQLDFHIECDNKTVGKWAEENLREVWTQLVRSLSSAFVFGFSANAVEWENDPIRGKLVMNKIKDLVPDECTVNWRYVDSALNTGNVIAPKVPIFDGIKQRGGLNTIPVTNSVWYPLLMENGDMYGKRLLRSAFQPWFFSSLIHLYQNKYFERFGEPVPIGRAPYNERVSIDAGNGEKKTMYGFQLMQDVLSKVRARSAVVLPNTRTQEGSYDNSPEYDYQIEYLESQMRGADFDRVLTRLDDEMSLALFTPLMMLRTAESGGQNQGANHQQAYLWMLNAIAGDWKPYIDKYILKPMAIYNFGLRAKLPKIVFRKLGTAQQETMRALVQALVQKGDVKPNIDELGQHIGVKLEDISHLKQGNVQPADDPLADVIPDDGAPEDKRIGRPERLKNGDGIKPNSTTKAITARVQEQVRRAYARKGGREAFVPKLGYSRRLADDLSAAGYDDADELTARFNAVAGGVVTDIVRTGGPEIGPVCDEVATAIEGIAAEMFA